MSELELLKSAALSDLSDNAFRVLLAALRGDEALREAMQEICSEDGAE